MTLLRTKSIVVGSVIAYTGGVPEETQTFVYGPAEFELAKNDVVQVVDIDRSREAETPFARVTVAVLKGKCCGRVGMVAIDMSLRSQRGWRPLTHTGSIEAVRPPKPSQRAQGAYSMVSENRSTVPASGTVAKSGAKSGKVA